jgi:hypothetical protein
MEHAAAYATDRARRHGRPVMRAVCQRDGTVARRPKLLGA